MAARHAPQIKDPDLYEALLDRGDPPGKAARIANARAAGTLAHDSSRLEDRGVADLRKEATRIGIRGRSRMNRADLIAAIRKG